MKDVTSTIIGKTEVPLAHPNENAGSIYHLSAQQMPNFTGSKGSARKFLNAWATSILNLIGSSVTNIWSTMSSIFGNFKVKSKRLIIKPISSNLVIKGLAWWVGDVDNDPPLVAIFGPCQNWGAVVVGRVYLVHWAQHSPTTFAKYSSIASGNWMAEAWLLMSVLVSFVWSLMERGKANFKCWIKSLSG